MKNKYSYILDHPFTVAVHYRDYQKEDQYYGARHGNMSQSYYKRVFALFPKDALFVVFSDNLAWCKENLSPLAEKIIFIEGESYYLDFYLMSLCKNNIISNSTFSWWSAYLNPHPQKRVIASTKWMEEKSGFNCKDVIPAGWIKLPPL